MADFDSNRFKSNNQEYATPIELFKVVDDEFNFTIDVCADENKKRLFRVNPCGKDFKAVIMPTNAYVLALILVSLL